MTAIVSSTTIGVPGTVEYTVSDPQGNKVVLCQWQGVPEAGGVPESAAPSVLISRGPPDGTTGIQLSQSNVSDLLTALTNFASTGVLS
jgi:hypothetical protein